MGSELYGLGFLVYKVVIRLEMQGDKVQMQWVKGSRRRGVDARGQNAKAVGEGARLKSRYWSKGRGQGVRMNGCGCKGSE